MASRVAGIAWLTVDGSQYPLRGNFTVSPSPVERAMIAGQDYVHGYSENPRVPYIAGDVTLVPELSIETVQNITNSTVTAQLANGKNYVLRQAVCTAALELNTKEGQVSVRFEGISCDEF